MAAATLTITDREVNDALARVISIAGDVTPALKNIGEYEASATKRRFIDERDPDGNAWAPLNPLYRQTKKGPGILRGETRSLSQIVWQLAGSSEVEIGSNEVYARIHNEGGIIVPKSAAALVFSMGGRTIITKSVKIPQRTFLGFSAADTDEIMDILRDYLAENSAAE